MFERLLITGIIGLLSVTGFKIVNNLQRQRVTATSRTKKHKKNPHILYFQSDNCNGCAVQSELMSQLNDDLQHAIEKVDVDANPQQAEAYGVMSLPTTIVIAAAGNARFLNYGVVNPSKLTNQWMSVLS